MRRLECPSASGCQAPGTCQFGGGRRDSRGPAYGSPFSLGEDFSVVDGYLFLMYLWSCDDRIETLPERPKWAALAERVWQRSAVKDVVSVEQQDRDFAVPFRQIGLRYRAFGGRPNFLAGVTHWPRVGLLLWSWTISQMLWRAVIGICWMMAECSATCARATANCTRANGGFVSCARVRREKWSSPPMVGLPVFALIRLKKSPSIIFCLARRSCHSEQPVVTSHANFARTGTFRSPEHLTSCRLRRHRNSDRGAVRTGCKSVAFTYNDPVIFLEYAVDVAQACRARGLKTVAVSAGYICPERVDFFQSIDAANIDLKSFTETFYRDLCSSKLAPVLETLMYLKHETDVWVEITTLLIPGENDSDRELNAECAWIAKNLGPDVPLHFSAFSSRLENVRYTQHAARHFNPSAHDRS